MAHYAKIENGIVVNVIVAEQDFIDILKSQDPTSIWIQTSYNTRGGIHYDPVTKQPSQDQSKAIRKNYAGIGFTYNNLEDCFIPPKPYPSWNLNPTTCLWDSPVPYPEDGSNYTWDETGQAWVKLYMPPPT